MAVLLLISLTLFSFFPISYSVLPSETVFNAVEILSDSGFVSMSLTLQLISQNLLSQSPSATIFGPSDAAFVDSGQPTFSLLQYHISPLTFSLKSLRSLPFGTKIPTLYPNHSLIVTTLASDSHISLNNVKINGLPIFDVGSLVVFGIDKFFDPSFQISTLPPPVQSPSVDLGCTDPFSGDELASGVDSFSTASGLLKSSGYSVMATFLDLQLPGHRDQMKMTVFAPIDESMEQHAVNYSDSSIFHRYVLPCRLTWADLVNFDEGTTLPTYSGGFNIKFTKSGDILVLNGVPVIFPDMYSSDSLVIHGLQQRLNLPEEEKLIGDSEFHHNSAETVPVDYGEFEG